MADDVLFRLSPGDGPPPEAEILFHAQRAREFGYTRVGLRRGRNADRVRLGESRLFLITSEVCRRKTVLCGVVREVCDARPGDDLLDDLYRGHDFPAWWRVDDVECVVADFDSLNLRKADGTPYDTAWLGKRQPFNYLPQACAWPAGAADAAERGELAESAGAADDLVAPPLTAEDAVLTAPPLLTAPPPA